MDRFRELLKRPLLAILVLACAVFVGTHDPGSVWAVGNDVAIEIAAGEAHTCALTSAGAVKCWGDNGVGQLGPGASARKLETPTTVTSLESGVVSIAAGGGHTCALTSVGAVKCWGLNRTGELGNGTGHGEGPYVNAPYSPIPVQVVGLQSGVVAIAAGLHNTCAVLSTGETKCWGDNQFGQLGVGSNSGPDACPPPAVSVACAKSPVSVANLGDARVVTIGNHHMCAVITNGAVKCWGENEIGQLGQGSNVGPETCYLGEVNAYACSTTPVAVPGTIADGISANGDHTCATESTSAQLLCWGSDRSGALGNSPETDEVCALQHSDPAVCSTEPVLNSVVSSVRAVAAGGRHTCTISGPRRVIQCWGGLTWLPDLAGVKVSAGQNHACAITDGGRVYCAGDNYWGQTGGGTVQGFQTTNPVGGAVEVLSRSRGGGVTRLPEVVVALVLLGVGGMYVARTRRD